VRALEFLYSLEQPPLERALRFWLFLSVHSAFDTIRRSTSNEVQDSV
jgi:hypothetical protein